MAAQLLDVTIDRSSPVPLYHQLAAQLSAAIDDGRLAPGDPFENEVALGERLRLSRPTVRRAIQEMVDEGLLVRRRGLGTTVANRRVHRDVKLTSLFDDLDRDGRSPSTVVLSLTVKREDRAAVALDLPPDREVVSLIRVRLADGVPLAVMHNWLPPALADLTTDELAGSGLYAGLRARGLIPKVARQSIGARMPSAAERRHLSIRGSIPVLTMSRVAFDASGTAIEFGEHCYRSDGYAFDVMVDDR